MIHNTQKKIRIALFGNTCNCLYQIAKAIRRDASFDVHLFIDKRSDPQQLPESDDPELLNDYPEWIHKGKYITPKTLILPWLSDLTKEMKKFDIIIVSHFGPLYSQFSGKPSIFISGGADLVVHPFALSYLFMYYTNWPDRIGALFMSFWQKRGLRRCTEIWSQPFYPFEKALKKLKIDRDKIAPFSIRLIIDTQKFQKTPPKDAYMSDLIRSIKNEYDFTIFHPSRILVDKRKKYIDVGFWKNNDLLFKGYQYFLNKNKNNRAVLLLIDRPASKDKEIAQNIIEELGIADKVLWLKPPRPFGFTRDELIPIYTISDVVADDFGAGWFGSIVIEGLAVGSPVLSYVDEKVMNQLYPWHPIISANTVESIAQKLTLLYLDKEYRVKQSELGIKWIRQFHSYDVVAGYYSQHIQDLVKRISITDDRSEKS